MLITDPTRCLIEEEPLQAQQRPDHVFANSLSLALGLCPDLAVDIETRVAPAKDFLDKRKADELFPEKQGKNLMGEDFLDGLVMEATDAVKITIRGGASFGNQDMDMRMEVYAVAESLDHGHHPRHKLKTCGCVEKYHKCSHRREAEIIEELSLETEEKTQHLGNGEDDLPVRDIQEKFLPHPFSPLLPALGMTRWTEPAGLAGKHQQALFPAAGTPDADKAAHRVAAVQILLDHILDHRAEVSVLLLKTGLVFSKEQLEIVKKHPVKHRVFRMTLAVYPCHSREDDS